MAKKKPVLTLNCPLYTEEELMKALGLSQRLDLGCDELLRKALFELIERESSK